MITHAERPELADRWDALAGDVWPEYNKHGDILNLYWPRLYDEWPEYQLVLCEEVGDKVLAEGHAIPCRWNGVPGDIPAGIDAAIEQGFEGKNGHNVLCVLAIEIPPGGQGAGLSRVMLRAMTTLAAAHGLNDLIAPVRPNWKERYPLASIESYASWKRDDGLPFDPWIRVHHRSGADQIAPAPHSLRITGAVSEWEAWTEMRFPVTGTYVFPRGLAPLDIDVEADTGSYWEPNVWMRHRVPRRM